MLIMYDHVACRCFVVHGEKWRNKHIPHLPKCSKVFGAGCSQKTVAIDAKTGVVIYNPMGGTKATRCLVVLASGKHIYPLVI